MPVRQTPRAVRVGPHTRCRTSRVWCSTPRVACAIRPVHRSTRKRSFTGSRTLATHLDFDSHPELVICAGHVEHDGAVVLIRPAAYVASPLPARLVASRADHTDDEQFVREYTETPTPVKHKA